MREPRELGSETPCPGFSDNGFTERPDCGLKRVPFSAARGVMRLTLVEESDLFSDAHGRGARSQHG
jgi:hypothetical protein